MVGLPARGKSFLSQKLCSFYQRLSISASIFNLGDYRRKNFNMSFDASFFNEENEVGKNSREICAQLALEDALNFLEHKNGKVAIYDGTNTTEERRLWLKNQLKRFDFKLVWIEMFLEDEAMYFEEIKKSKINNGDYKDIEDTQLASNDFLNRIEEYKKVYIPINAFEVLENSYVKITNFGDQVSFPHECDQGQIQKLLEFYLLKIYSKKSRFEADIVIVKDHLACPVHLNKPIETESEFIEFIARKNDSEPKMKICLTEDLFKKLENSLIM